MSGSAKSGANMIRDFTSGSIPQQMLRFSLPFMFSNVLQIVYSLVDMAVVGQYVGKEGRAAVSIASEVCNFMTMSCMGGVHRRAGLYLPTHRRRAQEGAQPHHRHAVCDDRVLSAIYGLAFLRYS